MCGYVVDTKAISVHPTLPFLRAMDPVNNFGIFMTATAVLFSLQQLFFFAVFGYIYGLRWQDILIIWACVQSAALLFTCIMVYAGFDITGRRFEE